MGKTIGLKQLAQKKYILVPDLPATITSSLGNIEDAFDMLLFGKSGSGKSNFTAIVVKELIKAMKCRAEYVSYEEGHGRTIQTTLIDRHNFLNDLGNVLQVTEHLTFEELMSRMGRNKSAKIWVIDSIQASRFTAEQCAQLKRKYVLGRKRKIVIYVSWSEGKAPQGACAKSVEYYANIKVLVDNYIAFVRSRYGGNKNFIVWEEGAKKKWGAKLFNKHKNR